ncbi:MAG: hypothetical protein ACRDYA_04335 [Egibacteraceae bacterium]
MRRSPADDADTKFILHLFVALGLACALAWAAGQLAGLLFAQTWLRLGLVDLPWILYGWIRNWRDPALAWPTGMRGLLPGPVGMYFCLALVVVGPLAAFHWVRLRWRRPGSRRSSRAAQWASRWQVRRLAVRHAVGWVPDLREAISRRWAVQTQAVAGTAAAALVLPLFAAVSTLRLVGHGGRALGVVKASHGGGSCSAAAGTACVVRTPVPGTDWPRSYSPRSRSTHRRSPQLGVLVEQ